MRHRLLTRCAGTRLSNIQEDKPLRPVLYLGTFLFLTLFIFIRRYVRQERYIYFWDYATYYLSYRDLGAAFARSPWAAIVSIIASIRHDDYNYLPTLFLLPFYYLFGPSRLAYISGITITFAFPAILLFSILSHRLVRRYAAPDAADHTGLTIISLAVIALLPQVWVPVLLGYVDVVGLNVIFLILLLYLRAPLTRQSRGSLISLGLLLSLLIILRRWYAYWVIGFFVAMAAQAALSLSQDKAWAENLRRTVKNILLVGLTALGSFFVVATPLALRMLGTNYGDTFSAYRRSTSLWQHLEKLYQHFGLITVLLSLLGVLTGIIKKELRPLALFFGVNFVVTFLLFTRVQDLDLHHYYWVIASLVLFMVLFCLEAYARLKSAAGKAALVAVLITISCCNFLIVFNRGARTVLSPVAFALPRLRREPRRRRDLEQVHALLNVLNNLTRDSDDKVYVLTSAMSLNSSILKNGCYEFEPSLRELDSRIMSTNDVDKRDGFPYQFLKAKYDVVTTPIGYHLAPADQRVIGVLAGQILNHEGLGQSYQRLPYEFTLDDGLKVYIYEKQRRFDAAELKRTSDLFISFYPDKREMFDIKPESVAP